MLLLRAVQVARRSTLLSSNNLSKYVNFQRNRKFSVTSCQFYKKYQDVENDFNYSILKHKLSDNVDKEVASNFDIEKLCREQIWSEKSNSEILDEFSNVAIFCKNTSTCISDERFTGLVQEVIRIAPNVNDQQLSKLLSDLTLLPETPKTTTHNFFELWSALDDVCYNRISKWSFDQLLYFANHWYKLNLSKKGSYTTGALRKMSRKFKKLNAETLVSAMFYLNLCRKAATSMFDIEVRFKNHIEELNIDEIGVVCIGFFKTETRIHNTQLVEKIYRRTIESIDEIKSISLVNILKALRYSSEPTHARSMAELSEKLLEQLDRHSYFTKLHIALLGTNIQYCHDGLIEKIIRDFHKNIKGTRLKDIERVAFILGLYNFKTKDGVEQALLKDIAEECKLRITEILKYPKCLPCTVHYLTLSGYYDMELINSVLNEKFIYMTYGRNHGKIGREVMSLDCYTRINLKDVYQGSNMSQRMRVNVTKYSSHYIPYKNQPYKLTFSDKILLDIQENMENLYGASKLTHVLPHFERPDIIYMFDENNQPITSQILTSFPKDYSGEIVSKEYLLSKTNSLSIDPSKYKLIAVVVGGWNFFVRDSERLTGVLQQKIDQLRLVGYEPILIEWFKWTKFEPQEKNEFIQEKILDVLGNTTNVQAKIN